MPKLFGLDSSTVRQIQKLFALDGATPRRVKKLFSKDGNTVRLIFEDFSTFTVSGTSNLIQSPVNEVIRFGVRDDFNAGGADVTVNASGSGDTNNIGGVSGLRVDVDSNHSYTATVNQPISNSGGQPLTRIYEGNSPDGLLVPNYITSEFPGPYYSGGATSGGSRLPAFGNARKGFYDDIMSGSSFRSGVNSMSMTASGGPGYSTRTLSANNWHSSQSGDTKIWYQGGYRTRMRATGHGYNYRRVSFDHLRNANNQYYSSSLNISNFFFAGITTQGTATGRRARVQNGTNRPFNVTGGGLNAGGNFSTGNLNAGASTGFITANSTSEAFTLQGVATKNPATFSISNADNSITVSGTFGDNENATQARDRIQGALNGNSTFQSKFNTGTDANETHGGVAHKVVIFTSDTAENTSDFSITISAGDGSNTTPFEETTTQGVPESLQTTVQVNREVEGSPVSSTKAISSLANTDTAGAEVATLGTDISYDASTNKLKVQDQDATINVTNAGSLSFSKD